MISPAIAEFKVKSHFQQGLILFHGSGDGHLHFVPQELSLLVAGLDVLQDLLNIGCL